MGLLLNRRRMMMGRGDEVIMTSASNPEVMAICYAQGWCASADKMTKTEAESVTNIGVAFRSSNIVHFDELQYFGITNIPNQAFFQCAGLTSIVLPNTITSIGVNCFNSCAKLGDITCLAPTAPTVMDTTFTGTGARASAKVLQVPSGASGYNESYWQTVLQDTNGFTLMYI